MKEETEITFLGFWVYLMTDLIMFAVLFATYAVLRNNTFGGPTADQLFSLKFVFIETMILLTSSFTIGLAALAAERNKKAQVLSWIGVTGALGVTFLIMELSEFSRFIHTGASFTISAFLSSYFALVGTHGLHIAVGLLWIIVFIISVGKRGLSPKNVRGLTLLSFFWHFLDIVWIFIFTFVYLMGKM